MEALTDHLDATAVTAVLLRELSQPPLLLPPNPVAGALATHDTGIADWVCATLGGPWFPASEQVVATSKARHAVRPVAIWDLPSRLAYGALTDKLRDSLPPLERSARAWEAFQTAPLSEDYEYIVSADIASCYQLIDHGELAKELLTQTGDGQVVASILALLGEVCGRSYGIPQQSAASDILAEAFLARLERAVIRKGLVCTRYNDDFRMLCPDWSSVVRSIEVLSEEARNMGLLLNDSKVITYRRVTYEKQLTNASHLREEIAHEAQLDLTQLYVTYGGEAELVEPGEAEVELQSAVRVLERWKSVAGRGSVAEARRREHMALVDLLPVALRALRSVPEDAETAIDITFQLLRFEQPLTPHVCQFLESRTDHSAVLEGVDKFLRRSPYLTGWQAWWLGGVVSKVPGFGLGSSAKKRREWLEGTYSRATDHQVLRAHAALALARTNMIDHARLLALYDRTSDIARPVLVAAIAQLNPPAATKRAVTMDSKLHAWIYDWAENGA